MIKYVYALVIAVAAMGFANNVGAQQSTPTQEKQVRVERERRVANDEKTAAFVSRIKEAGAVGMGIPNLTDDQKAKIKEIRLGERKQLLQIRNQVGEKKARMRTLETADKADLKEINKTIDEMAKLQADMMKAQAESKQKIRSLLTDEQRVSFDSRSEIRSFQMGGGMPRNNVMMYRMNGNKEGAGNAIKVRGFGFKTPDLSQFTMPSGAQLSMLNGADFLKDFNVNDLLSNLNLDIDQINASDFEEFMDEALSAKLDVGDFEDLNFDESDLMFPELGDEIEVFEEI